MGFQGAAEAKLEQWAHHTINWCLVGIAVALILIVLFVENKWFKSAVLAWIVLP